MKTRRDDERRRTGHADTETMITTDGGDTGRAVAQETETAGTDIANAHGRATDGDTTTGTTGAGIVRGVGNTDGEMTVLNIGKSVAQVTSVCDHALVLETAEEGGTPGAGLLTRRLRGRIENNNIYNDTLAVCIASRHLRRLLRSGHDVRLSPTHVLLNILAD